MTGAIVSCVRVDGCPEPFVPSIEERCADCGHAVWLSVASRDSVVALEGELPPLICEVCLPGKIAGVSRS